MHLVSTKCMRRHLRRTISARVPPANPSPHGRRAGRAQPRVSRRPVCHLLGWGRLYTISIHLVPPVVPVMCTARLLFA
jgi:hypothetical protein